METMYELAGKNVILEQRISQFSLSTKSWTLVQKLFNPLPPSASIWAISILKYDGKN